MTIRNLNLLFQPSSVALIGASEGPGSFGLHVAENLLRGGFSGEIGFVNPSHDAVLGKPCYRSIEALPFVPDLAVIVTPAKTVPGIIDELGRKGCKAAVVITAGIAGECAQRMLDAAKPYLLRIIGPNCLGLQIPGLKLNASFAHRLAKPGDIALVSQSAAITSAMLDWAAVEDIGFSNVASIGDAADVDFGDMLDYLAGDITNRAVFLYIESVTNAAKFMSAARRCARTKPVIAIKAGRYLERAAGAEGQGESLAGTDNVYTAALRRAGILRVADLDEMFEAGEVLARMKTLPGSRIAIVTNGDGPAILAADKLADLRGTLTTLEAKTIEVLSKVLPPSWVRGNPVLISRDAGPDRYSAAVEAIMQDENADVVLVMNSPAALLSSLDAAKATIAAVENQRRLGNKKPVVANWLSQNADEDLRSLFGKANIPDFETPTKAVAGIIQLSRYARAQAELMQTPPVLPAGHVNADLVDASIAKAIAGGRSLMTEPEAKAVLGAYGIPTVPTKVAATPAEAAQKAAKLLQLYASVVVKILSPDITYKSDIGGVRLDITSAEEVEKTAARMLARVAAARPDARIEGVTIQPMIHRRGAYELSLGIATDPTFGPVVLFGAGGTGVEAIGDTQLSLTPLDLKLASELIESTRIYNLLKGYRGRPSADLDGLALCLVKLSTLAVQHRAIRELEINPLLVDNKGMIALDARIMVEDPAIHPPVRCAIRPYPAQWEKTYQIKAGEVFVRPIRPEDERFYPLYMTKMDPEDIRMRLFRPVRELSHDFLARMTQIDYAREIAFVAFRSDGAGGQEALGVVRFFADPDYEKGEYAILIRSDLKGQGLGWLLMRHLIDYAKSEGLKTLYGVILAENMGMLQMCRQLGFKIARDPDDSTIYIATLDLTSPHVSTLPNERRP